MARTSPPASSLPAIAAGPIARLRTKARFASALVRDGHAREIVSIVRGKLWSRTTTYGMRRDLTRPFPAPDAALPITIRLATPADMDRLFDLDDPTISDAERTERRDRAGYMAKGLPFNYVAVTDDDIPCYYQTVLFASDNATLHRVYGSLFPHLEPHQCLLEGALTPEVFRGRKIMPAAMARITDLAAQHPGITEAITFVDLDNIPSLKGCVRSGFELSCHRHITWRFGRNVTTYTPLAADTPIPGVTTAQA